MSSGHVCLNIMDYGCVANDGFITSTMGRNGGSNTRDILLILKMLVNRCLSNEYVNITVGHHHEVWIFVKRELFAC